MTEKTKIGICSHYGATEENLAWVDYRTTCGEEFDGAEFRAATACDLPCGTVVRITELHNGKSVNVTVNDRLRGGASLDRILDMTHAAWDAIVSHDLKVTYCKYQIME
jgi:rare lipoprotein A